MPFQITQADIDATTDLEVAFGTVRNLPKWEDIPKDFKQGNDYTNILDCMFAGTPQKANLGFSYNEGFDDGQEPTKRMMKWVRAHLGSFEPKHEHKIAGLGYAMSKVITLHEA